MNDTVLAQSPFPDSWPNEIAKVCRARAEAARDTDTGGFLSKHIEDLERLASAVTTRGQDLKDQVLQALYKINGQTRALGGPRGDSWHPTEEQALLLLQLGKNYAQGHHMDRVLEELVVAGVTDLIAAWNKDKRTITPLRKKAENVRELKSELAEAEAEVERLRIELDGEQEAHGTTRQQLDTLRAIAAAHGVDEKEPEPATAAAN